METLRYADFSWGLHASLQNRRVPLSGTIEVTRRCPLRCAHCYNNLSLGDEAARAGELTCEEHCRILDEIEEAGCLWLLYTGGEIFVRPDFPDIYTRAKKKGFPITLFTSGVLVTPPIADLLAERPPFLIEITLYGATRITHERITGIEGSYDRCLRGIRLLRERGLPVRLKTMALTPNRHEIDAMARLAEEDLGLDFRFDAVITPRIDRAGGSLDVRLSPQEVVDLDLRDPRRVAEWRRFCERFGSDVACTDERGGLYHCGGGITSFAIDPYGNLRVCAFSRGDAYDLRGGTFREGWEDFIPQVRRRRVTRQTKCLACALKAMCGMCPANGELENGDPEEPVDFLCRVAHLRARALGIPAGHHGECAYC